MSDLLSILIVDQQEMTRRGINSLLNSMAEFKVIADVGNGAEALAVVKRFKPRLVLMDLNLPDMDAAELIRQTKRLSSKTHVVIFTSREEPEDVLTALEAGATSYLLKDTHSDRLIEALLHAEKGEMMLHPVVATRVLRLLLDSEGGRGGNKSELTMRELEVLKLIASGKSNQEIAGELVISVSTVKAHVSNILGKLHLDDRTQAAAYAWETGLMQRYR